MVYYEEQPKREREIINQIRKDIFSFIEKNQWTNEVLAEKLGLSLTGVRVWKERYWDIETEIRAALALGMEVKVELTSSPA